MVWWTKDKIDGRKKRGLHIISLKPRLCITINPKWSYIEYDFWPIDYDLSHKVCEELYQILDILIKYCKEPFFESASFGRTSGFIKVRTDFLPVIESIIKEKILNKDNWVPLFDI